MEAATTRDSSWATASDDPAPPTWFLSPAERGNPQTEVDRRRGGDTAYTDGNNVHVLIHGAEYFARLLVVSHGLPARHRMRRVVPPAVAGVNRR